jgi:hypothetical protein
MVINTLIKTREALLAFLKATARAEYLGVNPKSITDKDSSVSAPYIKIRSFPQESLVFDFGEDLQNKTGLILLVVGVAGSGDIIKKNDELIALVELVEMLMDHRSLRPIFTREPGSFEIDDKDTNVGIPFQIIYKTAAEAFNDPT